MYKLHVSPRLKWVLLAQSSNVLFLQPSLSLGRGQPNVGWKNDLSMSEMLSPGLYETWSNLDAARDNFIPPQMDPILNPSP